MRAGFKNSGLDIGAAMTAGRANETLSRSDRLKLWA